MTPSCPILTFMRAQYWASLPAAAAAPSSHKQHQPATIPCRSTSRLLRCTIKSPMNAVSFDCLSTYSIMIKLSKDLEKVSMLCA